MNTGPGIGRVLTGVRAAKIFDNSRIVENVAVNNGSCSGVIACRLCAASLRMRPFFGLAFAAQQVSLRPMDVQTHRFMALGGHLSCLNAGPAEGPDVILLHGLGWDAERLWHNQIRALAQAGWRVHAPDMRGVGQSVPLTGAVTIVDYADDVALLLAEARIARPMLVGFSMGCVIATELALRPEVNACGLVLACGGLRSTEDGEIATERMLERARDLGPEDFSLEQSTAIFGKSYARNHPDAVADFVRWRAEMDQPSLHHAFRAGYGCDYEDRLSDLRCPVSVIAADQDNFLSLSSAYALAEKAAEAPVHAIKDSGHMVPVEQPEAFAAALLTSLHEVRT